MNELFDDVKSVVLFLLGAMMSILTWIGKRHVNRFDREVSRIGQLEAKSVTRDELAKTLAQMREDRLQMHRENREELRYIRERVDGIADRQ